MTLGGLVGIDLIAAMQQQRKRLRIMLGRQPRPHRVALGPVAVKVAMFFAVARHEGQSRLALGQPGKWVVAVVPAVRGRAVQRHIKAGAMHSDARHPGQLGPTNGVPLPVQGRQRPAIRGNHKCGQMHPPVADVV